MGFKKICKRHPSFNGYPILTPLLKVQSLIGSFLYVQESSPLYVQVAFCGLAPWLIQKNKKKFERMVKIQLNRLNGILVGLAGRIVCIVNLYLTNSLLLNKYILPLPNSSSFKEILVIKTWLGTKVSVRSRLQNPEEVILFLSFFSICVGEPLYPSSWHVVAMHTTYSSGC